jgi:hypothetical protein
MDHATRVAAMEQDARRLPKSDFEEERSDRLHRLVRRLRAPRRASVIPLQEPNV